MNVVVARGPAAGLKNQSDEQGVGPLVIGNANTPPAASVPEVSKELKDAVAKWYKEHAETPGYRAGSSYAPEQMRETIEISSALQLPKILAKLHGQDASNIRLQFPQPDSSLSDEQRTAIRQEQTAIHAFLRGSHGKPLNALLNEAKDLIASSASLQRGIQDNLLPQNMTAEQWIAVTVGEKLEQITKHPQQLAVSDVVEIGSRKIEKVKPALEIALGESVESSRGLIVTIPNGKEEKISELREVLKTFAEAKRASGVADEQLERIKVWVGPTKTDITKLPQPGSRCNQVKEFSLLEFLKDESAVLVGDKKSLGDTNTKTDESPADASASKAAKEASTETEEVAPPVEEAPGQTAARNVEDLCFQTLVTPPHDPSWSYNTIEMESQSENQDGEKA